jgi:tRNA pseudouridine55 synthase
VLVVDKPAGPTSHDVVAVARRALGISRVGHTGTLDPRACGVLPLVVGQATRLAQHLSRSDKEYEAIVRFGVTTDTYDLEGRVVEESGAVPSEEAIRAALTRFRGTFLQSPPPYSARLVNGARAYARARAGQPVQPPATQVTVHRLELRRYEPPCAELVVRCSAGFYVRSLAHDLGQELGTGAVLDRLVRTEAAGFRRPDALSLAELAVEARDELRTRLVPVERLLTHLPEARLTPSGVERARHGAPLSPRDLAVPLVGSGEPTWVRLMAPNGRLVGLGRRLPGAAGLLQPAVVLRYN